MEIFIIWFGLSCIAGYVGGKKGHSGAAFFFLSLLLSPLIRWSDYETGKNRMHPSSW